MGGSEAETIHQSRERLKGQPQEGQHSAAAFGGTRDRLPPARGAEYLREGSSPKGQDCLCRLGARRCAHRARPAKPDAPMRTRPTHVRSPTR
jgi:hypothetical protein